MDAISLVDGFVKLYDGMTNSFVTRRTDVLMRVRGVLIHGVGKLSLVTSHSGGVAKGRRRSFFGVRNVKDGDEKAATEKHQDRPESEHIDLENEMEESRKRRRLLSAVDEIAGRGDLSSDDDGSSKWTNDLNGLATQVRRDVMDLYWSHYMSEILTEDDLPDYEMEGWNRLQSIDEDSMGSDDVDLDHSRRQLRSVSDAASATQVPKDILNGTATADAVIVHLANFSDASANMALNKSAASILDSVNGSSMMAYLPESSVGMKHVYPFPYVMDDADDSVKKHSSPPGRLPARESVLEANLRDCEFEINVDVEPIKWSYGEWRSAVEHRMRIDDIFNPFYSVGVGAHSGTGSQPTPYLLVMKSQLNFLEEIKKPEEALIMTLSGDMQSENCDIRMFVNVTASRISWEHTTAKAINYSFYMMLTCLTQIIVLLRQLLHTQSNSVATNVSLMCIGWQAVLDAIVSVLDYARLSCTLL